MKSVEDIYGAYVTVETAKRVVTLSEEMVTILTMVRNERVAKDLHDERTTHTVEALEFWKHLRAKYVDYSIRKANGS